MIAREGTFHLSEDCSVKSRWVYEEHAHLPQSLHSPQHATTTTTTAATGTSTSITVLLQ